MERGNLENTPVSDNDVIEALDNFGFEDDRTYALLNRFIEQCEREEESQMILDPGNVEATLHNHRVHVAMQLRIGKLYANTKNYKGQALEHLDDVLTMALQHESTQDLATEIIELIGDLGKIED